jgi:peptide deformylase
MSIKPIVSNIKELRKPCEIVKSDEDVSSIIQDLKDTLIANGHGLALAANQIGVLKQICYIRIPLGFDPSLTEPNGTKHVKYSEYVMINPKIIEKDKPVKFVGEGCLSFGGIRVDTKRYIYITVQFEDENRKVQLGGMQDIESFCASHEIDHLNGITIFDRKWRAK